MEVESCRAVDRMTKGGAVVAIGQVTRDLWTRRDALARMFTCAVDMSAVPVQRLKHSHKNAKL